MFPRPRFRLFPALACLLLAGCGSTGGNRLAGAAGSQPPLAAAVRLEDGTPVGQRKWANGSTPDGGRGQAVGRLACALPGSAYRYVHLSIFQDGRQLAVPAGIGVVAPSQPLQTGCVYPLHTDDASGKIRIDASTAAPTLGQFFAVWGQALSPSGVADLGGGAVAAYLNDGGALVRYGGDPSAIELKPGREITLAVGAPPAAIPAYRWSDPPPLAPAPIVLHEQALGVTNWPQGATIAGGRGQPVDGLPCGHMSEDYHVHTHLAIFKDGKMLTVPAHIGTPGTCNYPIHTHNPSGELHVEAPSVRHFTLGQFFDIWGQPLSAANIAGITSEPVKVYIGDNGDLRQYIGNPADIALTSHRSITIQIGSPPDEIPVYVWDTGK